ncbi:MAG TPA: hypothetical protein VGB37_14325 [Candidatus Lokiarchaeia archaeon]
MDKNFLKVYLNRELTVEEKIVLDNIINNESTECVSKCADCNIKVYTQDSEPILAEDLKIAMWIDSSDNNRVYFIFKRGVGDQVLTELS